MRGQKSNLGKSYFIQLLIRENLSGAQLAKRLRGPVGERRGRGSGQGHTCPSGRGADTHLLPATNRHLTHVSACVFAGGGWVSQQKLKEWSPCKKPQTVWDQKSVPKEGVAGTGRGSSRWADEGQHGPGTAQGPGVEGTLRRCMRATATAAAGPGDARGGNRAGTRAVNTGGNVLVEKRWRGRPLRERWEHAAAWANTHQDAGRFRKRGCILLYIRPRCHATSRRQSRRHLGEMGTGFLPPGPTGSTSRGKKPDGQ